MELSPQQMAVVQAVAKGGTDIQVTARAGCGKSTTILEAVKVVDGTVAVFAFNKTIADEMRSKVHAGTNVQTFHSLGFSAIRQAVRNVKMDNDKVFHQLEKWLKWDDYRQRPLFHPAKKLIGLCKTLLCPLDNGSLGGVADDFDVDLEDKDRALVYDVVRKAVADTTTSFFHGTPTIDYNDMVYLPVKLDLPMPSYDYVFLDEVQDTSPVEMRLVQMVAKTGHLCYVGDDRQAIYGFKGADQTAMRKMKTYLEGLGRPVLELPLTITRRCPKNVVRVANYFVPDIEALPDAVDGVVRRVEHIDAKPGEVVLCRKNAPLLGIAYDHIRKGIPIYIRGKDIGAGLITVLHRLRVKEPSQFDEKLKDYRLHEIDSIKSRNEKTPWKVEAAVDVLDDKVDALRFIVKEHGSIHGVEEAINRLFADVNPKDLKTAVLLSSVHKFKGMEADTIWIQECAPIPGVQEENILYVAVTRSKHTLFVRRDPKAPKKPKPGFERLVITIPEEVVLA